MTTNRFDRINASSAPKKTTRKKKAVVVAPVEPETPPKGFYDKLADGDYKSKLPYPSNKDPNRDALRRAYREDESRLYDEFKADLFECHGVTNNPKAQRAFEIAWDHGHAGGFSDVETYFSDLVDLIKD